MERDAIDRFQRTIDVQLQLLDGIDNKAQRVSQYTVILVGVIFTAVSLIPETNALSFEHASTAIVFAFLGGITGLIVAIGWSIITYISSVQEYGPDRGFGYDVADGTLDPPLYREALLVSYSDAVARNRLVIDTNAQRFKNALAALMAGIVYVSAAGAMLLIPGGFPIDLIVLVGVTVPTYVVVEKIYREAFLVLQRELPDIDPSP